MIDRFYSFDQSLGKQHLKNTRFPLKHHRAKGAYPGFPVFLDRYDWFYKFQAKAFHRFIIVDVLSGNLSLYVANIIKIILYKAFRRIL